MGWAGWTPTAACPPPPLPVWQRLCYPTPGSWAPRSRRLLPTSTGDRCDCAHEFAPSHGARSLMTDPLCRPGAIPIAREVAGLLAALMPCSGWTPRSCAPASAGTRTPNLVCAVSLHQPLAASTLLAQQRVPSGRESAGLSAKVATCSALPLQSLPGIGTGLALCGCQNVFANVRRTAHVPCSAGSALHPKLIGDG